MTPGPTRVPDRVLAAGARPMLHHRTPEFSRELADLIALLQPVFGTAHAILPVHTTGRGAMEAAICNLFSPGDALAVCCNGKFGEMWATFGESYGLVVHRFCADYESDLDLDVLGQLLAEHRDIKGVAMAFGDTSTGVANDVAGAARIARSRGALLLVDGVSSIGGMPFRFDEWDVDVAVTASQKCLMSSPGLAFAVMSDRAWAANSTARLPRNYWNFTAIRESVSKSKPETPGTTPVHLVMQVAEALRMLHEEGLDNVYNRHARMAEIARRGASELGLAPQCPALRNRSNTLTAIALPPELPPSRVRDGLKARGILTAAGLDRFVSNAFRIGHMGDIREADVIRTMESLAEVLSDLRAGGVPADQPEPVRSS
jgi:serine---pyruvate transaminase